jgi:hypothetical protein
MRCLGCVLVGLTFSALTTAGNALANSVLRVHGAESVITGPSRLEAPMDVVVSALSVAPTLTKSFEPAEIEIGGTSTLTLTLVNPNGSDAFVMSSLTDQLPDPMTIADPANSSTTCSLGAVSATAGETQFTLLAGAGIPANDSCVVTVSVTSAQAAVLTNVIPANALQTNVGTNQEPAVAILTITTVDLDTIFMNGFDASAMPRSATAMRGSL